MYKYTGRLLARWTITGAGQAVNYAKPGLITARRAAVLDVLAGGQDRHPRRARTDVLLRSADPHAMLKIASLLPRRPHLLDMEVIVRHQDLKHCASITCMIRHYVARRAKVIEDHPHNAEMSRF
jgi:hypothetical protein